MLLLMAIVLIGCNPGPDTAATTPQSRHLAMRQVAHHLYAIAGDTTSMIPPSSQKGDTYSIELHTTVRYDTLPILMDRAMADYGISGSYEVTLQDCTTAQLLLGYNNVAMGLSDIPCRDRSHTMECYRLGVTYESPRDDQALGLAGGILLLVVGLLLWRNPATAEHTSTQDSPTILTSDTPHQQLTVDIDRQIMLHEGRSINLTFREAKLMGYMIANSNTILPRADIVAHVWEDEGVIVGRSLDVFISRLRKIIKEEIGDDSIVIKTVHGVGYQLLLETSTS